MRRTILIVLLTIGAYMSMAQTDLYKRYASREDVWVKSVSNFVLDSNVTADVTLLEAVDDQGWNWLCKEFSLVELTPQQMEQIRQGWDVTMFAHRDPQDPTKLYVPSSGQSDAQTSCYLGVSYLSRAIYIFCCATSEQSDIVVKYLIEKMHHSKR